MGICDFSLNLVCTTTRKQCMSKFLRWNKGIIEKGINFNNRLANLREAAVLVPLCNPDDIPSLLYTVRATKRHGEYGQVAFPGGEVDKNENQVQAALRETQKEIGLPSKQINIWGSGNTVPSRNNSVLITPVVGLIEKLVISELKLNTDEVSKVLTIPIEQLCDSENQYYARLENGMSLPVFLIHGYKISGITAYLTHLLLNSLLPPKHYSNEWMYKKITI